MSKYRNDRVGRRGPVEIFSPLPPDPDINLAEHAPDSRETAKP